MVVWHLSLKPLKLLTLVIRSDDAWQRPSDNPFIGFQLHPACQFFRTSAGSEGEVGYLAKDLFFFKKKEKRTDDKCSTSQTLGAPAGVPP